MKSLCSLFLGLLLVSSSLFAQEDSPEAMIKKVTDDVLTIVRQDKDIQNGNAKKAIDLVEAKVLPSFNFQHMTALAMGLRTLVRVGGMPPGTSAAVVAKEAGAPPWKVESLRRQWAKWSGDQRRLAIAVVALADADGAVKGGVLEGSSLVDEQKLLALEILVAATAGTSASEG